jgi:hypothetical protein
MAVTLKLDTIQQSQFEENGLVKRYVRGALIKGMTVEDGKEIDFLFNAGNKDIVPGMPQMGEALSASHPDLQLTRRQFIPLNGGLIRCALTFETPYGFAAQSSYIVRNSAFLSNIETNMLPGAGRTPLSVPGFSQSEIVGNDSKIPGDVVTLRIFRPMRQITVSVLAYGSPTSDGGDYIGTVNDDDWPVNVEGMTSKPTGYWLMNKFDTMTSKYQGYFTVDAAALTRTNEDWSEYGILRSRDTGRYAMVTDPDTTHVPPHWDYAAEAVAVKPYKYGIMYRRADKGILRVGPYETSSFATLFGFGVKPDGQAPTGVGLGG